METIVYAPTIEKDKEILSQLLAAISNHIPYSPDEVLKEYITWCYEVVFCNKDGKIGKVKQKELDYLLEQTGDKLRESIYERYQRGFEGVAVGSKRTIMRDITMLKKKARPRKKSHS